MPETAGGTWWIAPTPFDREGRVDGDALEAAVRTVAGWGVDGVTVLGVMGEAASLDDVERDLVLGAVARGAGGSMPFAVGCSAATPGLVVQRTQAARDAGATAAMVAAPPMVRDTDAVLRFFERVGRHAAIPVLLQDEPIATGVVLPPSVLAEAAAALDAWAVKLEDAPTPSKLTRLFAISPGLRVFGGLGGVSAYSELLRGAAGPMTGFAYPEVLRALRLAVERGDRRHAAQIFDAFLPLIAYEGQPGVGIAIRKELLRRRGVLPSGTTRGTLPAPEADALTMSELDDVLDRVGLTPGPGPLDVAAVLRARGLPVPA